MRSVGRILPSGIPVPTELRRPLQRTAFSCRSSGPLVVTHNNQNKQKGRSFNDGGQRYRRNRPNRRQIVRVRLGAVTSINLIKLPGTKGSSFLTTISGTRPGVTTCPFAALGPCINVVRFDGKREVSLTSVPNLVGSTRGGENLKRRFLGRIIGSELLILMVSFTRGTPRGSVQALLRRLSYCRRNLTEEYELIMTGGTSLLSPRALLTHVDRYSELCSRLRVLPISTLRKLTVRGIAREL